MITLDKKLTADGIVVTNDVLGKIATIKHDNGSPDRVKNGQSWYHQKGKWFVYPYTFPPYGRGAYFTSLKAAEFYVLALAHEMAEGNRGDNIA